MTTIDIYLQPMVWEFLRGIGTADSRAVAIPQSHRHLYQLITSNLEHELVQSAAAINRHCSRMVKGSIYITDYDASRYGVYIRIDRQAAISHYIYNAECDRLCQLIMHAHLFAGISVNAATRHFLEKYFPESGDLMVETIKKRYQRHYTMLEPDIISELQSIKHRKTTQTRT